MACFVSFRFGNESQKDKDQIEVGILKKAHWGEWQFKRAMWPFFIFYCVFGSLLKQLSVAYSGYVRRCTFWISANSVRNATLHSTLLV